MIRHHASRAGTARTSSDSRGTRRSAAPRKGPLARWTQPLQQVSTHSATSSSGTARAPLPMGITAASAAAIQRGWVRTLWTVSHARTRLGSGALKEWVAGSMSAAAAW